MQTGVQWLLEGNTFFTHDAQDVDGGGVESVEDEGAQGMGDLLLVVQVLAQVACKDAVP